MSNIPEGCKPFNLQEALEGKPVVTRDGRKVKIAGYNPEALDKTENILGWADGRARSWGEDGAYVDNRGNPADLFMAPETKDVWLVLWSIKGRDHISSIAFEDEDSAKKMGANVKNEGHIFHGIHKITITL